MPSHIAFNLFPVGYSGSCTRAVTGIDELMQTEENNLYNNRSETKNNLDLRCRTFCRTYATVGVLSPSHNARNSTQLNCQLVEFSQIGRPVESHSGARENIIAGPYHLPILYVFRSTASREGVEREETWGEVSPHHLTMGSGKRRKLPQRNPGLSPGRK